MVGFINDTFNAGQISATASDGANSIQVIGGWCSNLGITYASSTLSVTGADGTALSASNPGYVIIQSKANPGQLKKYTITENQGFIDDTGASEIIGNTFGWSAGVAITVDVPFFIYAVSNTAEDAIAFMISRLAGRPSCCPTVSKIGAPDDAVATEQQSFFSFKNIDETLYVGNPACCIGSFNMTMSTANDWTVTALTQEDGIGRFKSNKQFSMPTGQMGAAAGGYIKNNGGTAPTWSNSNYGYMIEPFSGWIRIQINLNGDGGTDGAGAVSTILALPFSAWVYIGGGPRHYMGSGTISYAGGAISSFQFYCGDDEPYCSIACIAKGGFMQNGDFTNGGRILSGDMTYAPDIST